APRVLSVDPIDAVAHVEDLARVYLDVRRLAFKAGRGLMDEDARVGQRGTLARGAGGEQQRAHRHRHAHAHRLDVRPDELHRVVDGKAGIDAAAGRVDVQGDVLLRVLA